MLPKASERDELLYRCKQKVKPTWRNGDTELNWKHTVGLILILLVPTTLLAAERPRLKHRWVYLSTNMLVEENVTTGTCPRAGGS